MKIRALLFAVVLMLIFGMCVSASGNKRELEADIDSNYYLVAYPDSISDAISKAVGMSKAQLTEYFDKNDIVLLAVNPDNTKQLKVSAYKNDFSELVGDIAYLDQNGINEIGYKFSDNGGDFKISDVNKTKYIVFTENLKDSGGDYISTQYITVKNGKIYQLSFYNFGIDDADELDRIVSTVKIATEKEGSGAPLWLTVLIAVLIAVFACVATVMIIGIVRRPKYEDSKDSSCD